LAHISITNYDSCPADNLKGKKRSVIPTLSNGTIQLFNHPSQLTKF